MHYDRKRVNLLYCFHYPATCNMDFYFTELFPINYFKAYRNSYLNYSLHANDVVQFS